MWIYLNSALGSYDQKKRIKLDNSFFNQNSQLSPFLKQQYFLGWLFVIDTNKYLHHDYFFLLTVSTVLKARHQNIDGWLTESRCLICIPNLITGLQTLWTRGECCSSGDIFPNGPDWLTMICSCSLGSWLHTGGQIRRSPHIPSPITSSISQPVYRISG